MERFSFLPYVSRLIQSASGFSKEAVEKGGSTSHQETKRRRKLGEERAGDGNFFGLRRLEECKVVEHTLEKRLFHFQYVRSVTGDSVNALLYVFRDFFVRVYRPDDNFQTVFMGFLNVSGVGEPVEGEQVCCSQL